eukprot:4555047-Pyramimonas_sp.AAC.1
MSTQPDTITQMGTDPNPYDAFNADRNPSPNSTAIAKIVYTSITNSRISFTMMSLCLTSIGTEMCTATDATAIHSA